MDVIRQCLSIAKDPRQTKWICPLLFLADATLCGLVVWKIPCMYSHQSSGNDVASSLTKGTTNLMLPRYRD